MVRNADSILTNILETNPEAAKEWNAFGCLKNDPRIAGKIGKIIRQLSFDEIPQLWNICKGDMAFIGPRPLEISMANSLDPSIREIRNSIKPGLTGLWQIGPRSDVNIRQMQRYDLIYIKRKSIFLDFYILLKTIKVVIDKTGI